jgi:hypothetical protein
MNPVTARGTEIAHCQLDTLRTSHNIVLRKALRFHKTEVPPTSSARCEGRLSFNIFAVAHLAILLRCRVRAPHGTIISSPQSHRQYERMRVLGNLPPRLTAKHCTLASRNAGE